MKTYINPPKSQWRELLIRPMADFSELESKVAAILKEVKLNGDKALLEFTKRFDGVEIPELEVSQEEIEKACIFVDKGLKHAISTAARNIEVFHKAQRYNFEPITVQDGVTCWQKALPIEKVGLYIPGGTAPLFSTVLMLSVPAKIAGCKEILLATPPDKNGNINPAILYAAQLCGVTRIFKVGGAQAIAALAYGTESIPATYKIFGPGNQFVTMAKMLVAKEGIAIDMPAGPSEVMVVADDTANPEFVAADLLSQAEHGVDSQVILVSNSTKMIERANAQIEKQLALLPRKAIAAKALENSKAIFLESPMDIVSLINEYAPEHLILSVSNYMSLAEQITNAGSIFLGNFTPESAGDYASGTNHTLPTNGYAKAFSGLSLDSFMKKITFQHITREGLNELGKTIELMASAELLDAHKNAVSLRLAASQTENLRDGYLEQIEK
jgi:histidinol dehydrogenase